MDVIIKAKKAINLILRKVSYISTMPTDKEVVYLTFDDGPEDGITEFVLDELNMYGFKATFFCRGDNAEKHPELLLKLKDKGHTIGNHTYSHKHSYDMNEREYALDVKHADTVLHTKWFRPPHGSLTLGAWLRLHKSYQIVFWSLNSNDSDTKDFNFGQSITMMKKQTKPGDIVLFHFCHKHERETRLILPEYLRWLSENGYVSKGL